VGFLNLGCLALAIENQTGLDEVDELGRRRAQGWAFVLAAAVGLALAVGFACHTAAGRRAAHPVVLDGRINVNEAPVASLVRLPGIGYSRAKAIVTYREQALRQGRTQPFEKPQDLENIVGIGPKTVEALAEHLRFE